MLFLFWMFVDVAETVVACFCYVIWVLFRVFSVLCHLVIASFRN